MFEGSMEIGPSGQLELRSVPPAIDQPSQKMTRAKYIDRSIGLEGEETILASDAETALSTATRDSVNRFVLQTITEKLHL